MTEKEWLSETDDPLRPVYMINEMRHGSDRKLRLAGCAFCREFWQDLSSLGKRAIEVAELLADGKVDERTRLTIERRFANQVYLPHYQFARRTVSECGWYAAELTVGSGLVAPMTEAALIRDIFGNPFLPVALEHSWLLWNGGTVTKIAQHIYEERAYHDLPVLADALEEAGCATKELLGHCRLVGKHVRGCWVLDLLLGKK